MIVAREPIGKKFGPVPVPARKAVLETAPQRVKKGPAWFQAMDRNGDGFVSAAEFLGPPELFAKWDLDKDGRISVEEAEAVEK